MALRLIGIQDYLYLFFLALCTMCISFCSNRQSDEIRWIDIKAEYTTQSTQIKWWLNASEIKTAINCNDQLNTLLCTNYNYFNRQFF